MGRAITHSPRSAARSLYATDRSLRLSRSDVPPQTPVISESASAYSRHSCRTGQLAQMTRAFVVVPPRPGKNTEEIFTPARRTFHPLWREDLGHVIRLRRARALPADVQRLGPRYATQPFDDLVPRGFFTQASLGLNELVDDGVADIE